MNKTIRYDVILSIVFLVLKLTGYIDWKWIWVFSPIWISFLIVGIIFMIAYAINNPPFKVESYHPVTYGKRTYWDYKTKTIYGDFDVKEV